MKPSIQPPYPPHDEDLEKRSPALIGVLALGVVIAVVGFINVIVALTRRV